MRPNLRESLLACVLLVVAACGGGKKDAEKPSGEAAKPGGVAAQQGLPAIPPSPAPLPKGVLAAVSVGDPQGQLTSIASYADAVQPGFGAMLAPKQFVEAVGRAVGVAQLDGVDLRKPLHLLILDEERGGGQAVLVAGVADARTLRGTLGPSAKAQIHGGFAAIGPVASLRVVAPYALSNLAKSQPPKNLHAVLYMNQVMESYGPKLDQTLRTAMGPDPKPADKKAAEGVIKMMGAVDRIEGDLEASGQVGTASFALFPRKGSVLDQWAGLQQPSDYTVASRLPAGSWLLVAAGRIDLGPLKTFVSDMATAQQRPDMAEWIAAMGQELALAVLATEDKTVRVAGLVAVTDAKKLGQLISDYVKKMAAKPTDMDSMEVTFKANAYRTGGAALQGITIKPSAKTPPEEKKEFEKVFGKGGIKSYFGLAGNWMVFALDKDKPAKGLAAKLVSSSKSKEPKSALGESFEKALADSKTRKESGVMVIDFAALAGGNPAAAAKGAEVTLGVGFDGGVMRSRVSVPPATLRFYMQQQMRGMQQAPQGQPPPPPAKKQ
jgi:hypothetical protein